jgi:hypothetical protein
LGFFERGSSGFVGEILKWCVFSLRGVKPGVVAGVVERWWKEGNFFCDQVLLNMLFFPYSTSVNYFGIIFNTLSLNETIVF